MTVLADSNDFTGVDTESISATVTARDNLLGASSQFPTKPITASDSFTGTDAELVHPLSSDSGTFTDATSGIGVPDVVDDEAGLFFEETNIQLLDVAGIHVGFAQWMFLDPKGAIPNYTLPINPNSMTDPHAKKDTKSLSSNPLHPGRIRAWRSNNNAPRAWTFSGVTRTKDEQDQMLTWYQLDQRVWVRDHLSRVWEVRFTSFKPQPKRSRNVWRFTYQFSANVYRRVS